MSWGILVSVVDLKGNLVQLRDGIPADLTGSTVVICDRFSPILKTAADNSRLVINFADDKNRANNTGGETLQHYCLIVVYRYLGTVVGERDGIRRG